MGLVLVIIIPAAVAVFGLGFRARALGRRGASETVDAGERSHEFSTRLSATAFAATVMACARTQGWTVEKAPGTDNRIVFGSSRGNLSGNGFFYAIEYRVREEDGRLAIKLGIRRVVELGLILRVNPEMDHMRSVIVDAVGLAEKRSTSHHHRAA